eukprot:6255144-Pyramimonas_sp.AAC.1
MAGVLGGGREGPFFYISPPFPLAFQATRNCSPPVCLPCPPAIAGAGGPAKHVFPESFYRVPPLQFV